MTVQENFEAIMTEVDNRSVDMSAEDYEELLTELNSELEVRLGLIEEEKS